MTSVLVSISNKYTNLGGFWAGLKEIFIFSYGGMQSRQKWLNSDFPDHFQVSKMITTKIIVLTFFDNFKF